MVFKTLFKMHVHGLVSLPGSLGDILSKHSNLRALSVVLGVNGSHTCVCPACLQSFYIRNPAYTCMFLSAIPELLRHASIPKQANPHTPKA